MMKNICILLLASLLTIACTSNHEKKSVAHPGVLPAPFHYDTLEGVYSGDFNGTALHITLSKVTGRNAVGYALKKGVRRNISGGMEAAENGFHLVLREPGNDPADGVYDMTIDTVKFGVTGKWLPRQGGTIPEVNFVLSKTPDDYFVFADSLNKISFERNGECLYEFYKQDTDGSEAKQMTRLKGSWKRSGDCFTIDWEPNDILPAGSDKICTDSAKTSPEQEYFKRYLRLNGRVLADYSMM